MAFFLYDGEEESNIFGQIIICKIAKKQLQSFQQHYKVKRVFESSIKI